MKKLQVTILVGLTMLALAGCGKNSSDSEDLNENGTISQTTVEAPAETSTQTSTVAASEAEAAEDNAGWSVEMQQLKDKITEALGDEYWPDTQLSEEMLEGLVGLSSDMYDDYLAEMPMISVNVDTLLIVKAKNGNVESVENILESYRENLVNGSMEYPMNIGKIQASRIERIGNYVCFVQLGGSAVDLVEQGDEAVIAECLEQNELVLEIIRNNVSD
jgi:hypothetical protein